MKKLAYLGIVLLCILSVNLYAVNNNPEIGSIIPEVSDDPEEIFYSFHGTITWYGDEGIALFYQPGARVGDSLWVREAPMLLKVTFGNDVVIAKLDKTEWINRGCPSQIGFSLFFGYSYVGHIGLIVPYPDN